MRAAVLCALLAGAGAGARAAGGGSEPGEEIRVRGKGRTGPSVQAPVPGAHKPVVDEVIRSLDVYRTERRPGTIRRRLSAASERLSAPFPDPPFLVLTPAAVEADYDRWTFEILEGAKAVWRTEGLGRLQERIAWDGTGLVEGDGAARLMVPYSFRFTGEGSAPFVIESEPVVLKSLAHKDTLGATRLEVAAAALFDKGSADWTDVSAPFLAAILSRLRRLHAPGDPYKLSLSLEKPDGKLALRRAAALRKHFAAALLIDPRRVEVELSRPGLRGETLSLELPPEQGQRLRVE